MEKFEAVLSILGLDTKPTNASEAYEVFRKVKEVESIIEKRLKELREDMFELAEKEGVADDKGSFTVEFEDGTGYQKQARTSMSIKKDEVIDYAKAVGLHTIIRHDKVISAEADREEVIKIVEKERPDWIDIVEEVDEEELEKCVLEGLIPMEEFEGLVNRKVTYALVDLAKRKNRK